MSENNISKKEQDENDKSLRIIQYFRPILIKLTYHFILIFLSIRAYNEFISSSEGYSTFVEGLNTKIVTDVKVVDYRSSCPDGYDALIGEFPEIKKGCRCNDRIYPYDTCMLLNDFNKTNEEKKALKEFCSKGNFDGPPKRILQSNSTTFPNFTNSTNLTNSTNFTNSTNSTNSTRIRDFTLNAKSNLNNIYIFKY